jgi:hypothetical protein
MSATVFRGRSRLGFLPDSDLAAGFAAAFFGLPAEALAEVRATFATAAFLAAVFFFATARLAGFAAFLAADFFADFFAGFFAAFFIDLFAAALPADFFPAFFAGFLRAMTSESFPGGFRFPGALLGSAGFLTVWR